MLNYYYLLLNYKQFQMKWDDSKVKLFLLYFYHIVSIKIICIPNVREYNKGKKEIIQKIVKF